MNHMHVMTHGPVDAHPVGLATSVLRRSKAFALHGVSNTILINYFYLQFEESIKFLRDTDEILPETDVRYMYNELAGDDGPDERPVVDPLPRGEDWDYRQDLERATVIRAYQNGVYKLFIWMKEERVYFVDRLSEEGRRTSRDWYDPKGYLRKVEVMDDENHCTRLKLFGRLGNHFLDYLYDGSSRQETSVELFVDEGLSFEFSNQQALLYYWLDSCVMKQGVAMTLISEYGFYKDALQELKNRYLELRVVYTLHSNHFTKPYRYGSALKPELMEFFADINEYDAVVVLTDEQKHDIRKQFYPADNVHVIPHHSVSGDVAQIPRDPRKVVILGRFEEYKGQRDAVKAFKSVVERVPDAKLEIYGRGAISEAIQKDIDVAGLQGSVKIMGFSNDSRQVYSSAALALFPSLLEGFALSLQESMVAGCVPVAYDFRYGARTLISDGVDGFVVDMQNLDDLADTTVMLLLDRPLQEQMSLEARRMANRFSDSSVVKLWLDLAAEVHGRSPE